MLIAGDIGSTKTDQAIYLTECGAHVRVVQTQVHSVDYASLQDVVAEFLARAKVSVDVASFEVASPMINGHAKTTNLPWVMDERSLASDLNLKSVHLMNDLEAVARAVPVLRAADLITINRGRPVPAHWSHRPGKFRVGETLGLQQVKHEQQFSYRPSRPARRDGMDNNRPTYRSYRPPTYGPRGVQRTPLGRAAQRNEICKSTYQPFASCGPDM
jgi:hypothetical protein